MSLGSESASNHNGSGQSQKPEARNSNEKNTQKERDYNQAGALSQRPKDRSNSNNGMLNFNDNYAAILQNLASDNAHVVSQAFSPSNAGNSLLSIFSNNNPENGSRINTEDSRESPAADRLNNHRDRSCTDKQNLGILLQHYQGLLNKSASYSNSGGQSNSAPHSSVPNGHATSQGNNTQRESSRYAVTERPCDHCRRRQTKCVIVPDLASCVQCETKGIKCTFSELPNMNRRLNMPEYDQNGHKHPRSDDHENIESLLKKAKSNNNETVAQYYTELLQNLNDSVSPPNPTQYSHSPNGVSPAKVPSNPSLLNLLQTNQKDPQPAKSSPAQAQGQFPRSSFYVGATSVYDINLVNHVKLDHIDQVQLSPSVALRKVAPNVQFILRDNFNQNLYLKQEQEIDMVERLVYPHGKILIDIFFKLVHPYFPILHERVFIEKYARSYRELTAPLLASIYSLSLHWWDFHPKLIGFPKPDVTERLNEIAFRTFFDMIERPKLSMVQTGLLILRCRSECSNNWVLNSAVVALAEELGLGVDCQDWRLPRWERGLRRRLAWAVWAQDKWTALIESRHSHLILGRNWMVKMLSEEDFPTDSPVINNAQEHKNDPSNSLGSISLFDICPTREDFIDGTLMFKQMVSLSVILGEIMETFYTEGAVQMTTRIEQVLKLAKPLQLKLREWYHSLPPQLSMNKFIPRKFNANATLTLAYFSAEITLHRKIITTLTQETPKELVQVCRTAAKTRLVAAIEFVRDLKNEHVDAFWYSCSTGNLMLIGTFAALLYVTARTKDEALIFRDCLRNYIWILRVGSKSFDKSANALKRIHILLTQIPGLLTDEQPKEFIPPRSQSPIFSPQQWKISPGAEHSPPDFNQLRNLPVELLHSLSNMQGNSPGTAAGRKTNQACSPGYSASSRYEPNKEADNVSSRGNVNDTVDDNNNKAMAGEDNHSASFSSSETRSLAKVESNSNSAIQINHNKSDSIDNHLHAKEQEKRPAAVTIATESGRSNPITPQSVGNHAKENTPVISSSGNRGNGGNGSSGEKMLNEGSTISPSSIQDKNEPTNAQEVQPSEGNEIGVSGDSDRDGIKQGINKVQEKSKNEIES